jgi:hypothetical protein
MVTTEGLSKQCFPWRLRPERDCAGEDQQQQYITDLSSHQRGCYKITHLQMCLVPDTKTGWPADCQSLYNFDFGSLKWDSKIWLWGLWDFNPRVTALARPRSNCKSNRGCPTSRNWQSSGRKQKSGHGPQMGSHHQDRLAAWPSVIN